jgi:hypothetical protein
MSHHNKSFRAVCQEFDHQRILDYGFSFYIKDYIDDVALAANRGVMMIPSNNHTKLHDFFELADMFFEEEDDDG